MQRFAINIKYWYVSNTPTWAIMEYPCFLGFKGKLFDSNLNNFMNNLIFIFKGKYVFYLFIAAPKWCV